MALTEQHVPLTRKRLRSFAGRYLPNLKAAELESVLQRMAAADLVFEGSKGVQWTAATIASQHKLTDGRRLLPSRTRSVPPTSRMAVPPASGSRERARELENLRDQTGLPVARLLDLQRRGFEVRPRRERDVLEDVWDNKSDRIFDRVDKEP